MAGASVSNYAVCLILGLVLVQPIHAGLEAVAATITNCTTAGEEADSVLGLLHRQQLDLSLCKNTSVAPTTAFPGLTSLPSDGAALFKLFQSNYGLTVLKACSKDATVNATGNNSASAAPDRYYRFVYTWNNPCRGNELEQWTAVTTVTPCAATDAYPAVPAASSALNAATTISSSTTILATERATRRRSRKLLVDAGAGSNSGSSGNGSSAVVAAIASAPDSNNSGNATASAAAAAAPECGVPTSTVMASAQVPL